MSEIGVAVMGAGFIGPAHVEGLRRLGLPVRGILGVNDQESQQAAGRLGLPRAYRSVAELLGDPAVKAVHIATPNRTHFSLAQQAIQAGKHVLCEKPLSMNTGESARLIRLAQQARVAAGVNYNIRFYPLCLEAREMVRRGELGKVFTVCGSYVQDWLLFPSDYNWRVLAREGGELRAMADIGSHWLDLAQSITGLEVEEVCADLKIVHPIRQRPKGQVLTFKSKELPVAASEPVRINTEDFGSVLLRFKGGARGCLYVSQVMAGRKNCLRFEISGSNRTLAWNSEEPNNLWIGCREKANEDLLRDPALVSAPVRGHTTYPGGHAEGFPDTFKECFRAFYDYIRAGDMKAAPAFPTFADGHREIALGEAILRSHRQARWIKVRYRT